ncbi:ComF family protein [Sphingomonas sp. BN140010]|uniref:ComF family protein n=1 Tax=Sphingomonas arvum TaxID=2992113 RepID=A0ABT3JDI5_9SPHN|nr:ComF family protein [Sphingomonas sp. BN140010]MCW3796825.1 ComF family protein [Sphingomonas sp. BN140010]
MRISRALRRPLQLALDFALPPRCAGCGAITSAVGLFCPECWPQLDFMGGGCRRCGLPLEATAADTCGACLADSGALDRIRAAVAYGEQARSLVLRLKYGRKTALARTMAGYMQRPLAELHPDALLVPVPLHRSRLWSRGFNQAQLIAAALTRLSGRPNDPFVLQRTKSTPKLKGMSASERRRAVQGAFTLRPGQIVKGRHLVLVDDVYTTGSTADACARILKRKGAASVELLAWARVVAPARIV